MTGIFLRDMSKKCFELLLTASGEKVNNINNLNRIEIGMHLKTETVKRNKLNKV